MEILHPPAKSRQSAPKTVKHPRVAAGCRPCAPTRGVFSHSSTHPPAPFPSPGVILVVTPVTPLTCNHIQGLQVVTSPVTTRYMSRNKSLHPHRNPPFIKFEISNSHLPLLGCSTLNSQPPQGLKDRHITAQGKLVPASAALGNATPKPIILAPCAASPGEHLQAQSSTHPHHRTFDLPPADLGSLVLGHSFVIWWPCARACSHKLTLVGERCRLVDGDY
jgi:hypothetical protein